MKEIEEIKSLKIFLKHLSEHQGKETLQGIQFETPTNYLDWREELMQLYNNDNKTDNIY